MVNNNRQVENAYNMLQYLYDELKSKRFKTLDITDIKTLDELYSIVISRWCASIAKEGLYKEYVEIEDEELTSPKGQINIRESISKQTHLRGTLICSYDELSDDIYINHILKGTLQYMIYNNTARQEVKNEILKTLQLFNGVSYIDITKIHWKDVKFNNNNIRYKHLIEMCKSLVDEHRLEKTLNVDDDKRLYILFKKQVLKWFRLRYSDTETVELFERPYTMIENEPDFEVQISKYRELLAIRNIDSAVLINIRLQDEKILDNPRLPRLQLEEFVRDLRDFKKQYSVKVNGCLVYINTNKNKLNLEPMSINSVNNYMIGEMVVDINDQWRFIENKLSEIYTYFIQRNKGRK